VTPIPDSHPAARDLQRQFAELGRRQQGAARRVRRRRGLSVRRPAVLAAALLGLAAAGAGATKLLVADQPGRVAGDAGAGEGLRQAPRDARLASAVTADPGGGLPWGLRTYVNTSGDTCLVVGRLLHGRLGVLQSGRFQELASDVPGHCESGGDHLFFSRTTYGAGGDYRTVLLGLADRQVRAVMLRTGSREVPVQIGDDGSFLVVLAGRDALDGARLTARTADGTSVRTLP
jgi:hypothetical protein